MGDARSSGARTRNNRADVAAQQIQQVASRKQLYVLLCHLAPAWVTFGRARRSDKILWLNETPRGWNSSIRNLAKVMKLSFFSSLTVAETVWALDISERTVKSDTKCAPAWLAKELSGWR